MHIQFKLGLDKTDSLNYPNFEPEEIDLTQEFTFTNNLTIDNAIFRVLDANGDPLFEIDPTVANPVTTIEKLHVTDELISDVIIQQAGNAVVDVTTVFVAGAFIKFVQNINNTFMLKINTVNANRKFFIPTNNCHNFILLSYFFIILKKFFKSNIC